MAASLFFYDLETSGISATTSRIMQFAGQRTNLDLEPIGDPINVLIKLAGDVLPDPDAIMITGITPQSTIQEGLTEAEFLDYFYKEVVQPDTCYLGFNTVRFDDEFMRMLHYRNFYDPYEWQWQNGSSRWDLLDVVRMTRALRPEGISWPVTEDGKPTNRLELLTVANDLDHLQAHDALSDVYATIAVAKLILTKQPDLFKYLYEHRGKKEVAAVIESGQPFIYASGRYPTACMHTTAALLIAKHGNDALVYDLRQDPRPFITMTPQQMVDAWRYKKERPEDFIRLPVKTVKYNRCPAVAPLGVIKDQSIQDRLDLQIAKINQHLQYLRPQLAKFTTNVLAAIEILDAERAQQFPQPTDITASNVDGLLYNKFLDNGDKPLMQTIRSIEPAGINELADRFKDARLRKLAPLYKARNYPASLGEEERQAWDELVANKLFVGGQQSQIAKYFARLEELKAGQNSSQQAYAIEELRLYGESIVPSDITEQ